MEPGTKLGPFVIEEEIGSGAMGAVYRAQYRDKNLRVAIKVMAPGIGTGDTAQARFQREAEILKNLQHPNIVRLLAVGQYRKSPFYAMEYIEGETLENTLQRRGKLTWEEVIRLGQQLCSALQHAHDREVVHRDLKPSNLMLLANGTLKLTDFGIAKAMDMSGLTATNCTVGTASYMSPEQCKGDKDISPKSDLYSMGVLFYELATGRKPFVAESTMDMFMQHVKGKFRRPAEFEPNMPVWFDNLICQLLEKKPEDRPLSARLIGQTLDEILQKVEAQQSAGLERATARGKEKAQHRPRMDDADREAARALRQRRKKVKRTPFYQQGWFTLLAVLLLLGGFGYGVYYVFFVPPTLDALRKQAGEILSKDEFENWTDAQRGPLHQFNLYYANEKGSTADLMREWSDAVNGKIAERQLLNRFFSKKTIPSESNEETEARYALGLEEVGDLNKAMGVWKGLVDKHLKETNPEKRAWGLVGKRRYQQLEQLEAEWVALYKLVAKDKEYPGTTKEEKLAVKAIRAESEWAALTKKIKEEMLEPAPFQAELDKKMTTAKEFWETLKDTAIVAEDQRRWYLFAAYQLRELNKKPKAD